MYEPQLEAEALSEACGVPTVRLDHAARLGQSLLVLVRVHAVQQVDKSLDLSRAKRGGLDLLDADEIGVHLRDHIHQTDEGPLIGPVVAGTKIGDV